MSDQPLSGVRVVDLTTVLMGPFATQILGEHSAEVLASLGRSEADIAALAKSGITRLDA